MASRASRLFVRIFWSSVVLLFSGVVLLFFLIASDVFGPMPSFEELENPNSSLASEVLAEDHTVLGSFFVQNRSFATHSELSPHLIEALISTEDARFYQHSGIDGRGLGRVFFKTVVLGQTQAGGGSTLTQQLAKNLFPRDSAHSRSVLARNFRLGINKFKEWITAIKLERNYSKDEILTMYLNTVPFGANAYGIKMASRTFFNTTPDSLTIEQAAVLVGLVKGPTWYSPIRNPERSLERRNVVLWQMHAFGNLPRRAYDSLSQLPLGIRYTPLDHNSGLATYFREHLRIVLNATEPDPSRYFSRNLYVSDSIEWATNPLYGWCHKNRRPDGSPYNLYRDGLRIYTTIDANLQRYAEEAVAEHVSNTLQPAFDREKRRSIFSSDVPAALRKTVIRSGVRQSERYRSLKASGATEEEIDKSFSTPVAMTVFTWAGDKDTVMTPMDSMLYIKRQMRAGFLALEPGTGRVRAYVGGTNFRHFKYDQVYIARRQVGSTIKPFLYTLAMQEGYTPCTMAPNVPQVFQVADYTWIPKNSNATKLDGEMVSLKWGLAHSVNNISAWLTKQFTPEAVAALVKRMGIRSRIDPVPSIFLGTSEFSVYEMAAAYGIFASGGVYTSPLVATRIEDRNGNVLATFTPRKSEVISEQTAYLMVELLRNVVDHGSGRRLRHIYKLDGPMGGKTGTTQKGTDGWFMMVHPSIVLATWVGCEDPAVHFDGMAMGQGASLALPIQGLFMQKAYADPRSGIQGSDFWRVPEVLRGTSYECEDVAKAEDTEDEFFE